MNLMQFCEQFSDVKFCEKRSFLYFYKDSDFTLRNSRRKSAPAEYVSCPSGLGDDMPPTDRKSVDKEGVYTVMIKNVPCSCKREDVLRAVEEVGFVDRHDFFYMPMRHGKTPGYAFIGFPTAKLTEDFTVAMNGYQFRQKASLKTVKVVPATIQGLSQNAAHFKDTFVMQSDAKPLFREQADRTECLSKARVKFFKR